MTHRHTCSCPSAALEDVLSGRLAEGAAPMVLVGMPETTEAAALCLLLMLLERRGGTASEAEVLDLYRRCMSAANNSGAEPGGPWRQ